jgi:fluoroquinolone transport system permease protein
MKRLGATLIADVRLQYRNGFYAASLFILILWAVLLSQLPRIEVGWLMPPLVLGNLAMTTFYFVAGLVLLEKAEGTLQAQIVTPLRTPEYLASKVITLAAIALAENLILIALFGGWRFGWLAATLGIVVASAIYVLAGVVVVARYESINEFLMPSVLYTSALSLPLIAYLLQWNHWLALLHPMAAPLLLLQAAFMPVPVWQIGIGVVSGAAWIGLMALWSRRSFARFIVGAA